MIDTCTMILELVIIVESKNIFRYLTTLNMSAYVCPCVVNLCNGTYWKGKKSKGVNGQSYLYLLGSRLPCLYKILVYSK